MTQYFPASSESWERIDPRDAGFDADGLKAASDFAIANESKMDRDIRRALDNDLFGEPEGLRDVIGITRPRADPHGMILKGGRIVHEWGDTTRPDITFSIAKSYLSICAGLALDDGLIPSFDRPVAELVDDGGFDDPQNKPITWAQLLQQTSEWQGTLWSKPDWIDHNRDLDAQAGEGTLKGKTRDMQTPGTFWEYNDVRVNRLALALLRVWKRPLPEVIKERVMDPIGASTDWEWHGYENSWVDIDGKKIQSVSGGSHWGGGMFISSRDQARTGLLMARGGAWNGKQLISGNYIGQATTPCPINADYGYLWWLNGAGGSAPSAPRTSYFAKGKGSNVIWVDPELDMVAVVRWIERDAFDGFCGAVMKAVRGS
ncbi:serine hydrolase [uncultured Nisaea sp.]|mgnify:FL=1|jgi:CubicO group peptidase (beta-lactamase class C family)|uniref:serine hydrolase domain-containing protein n=1 Tax=uncultured Nisaea sp. TaxID=538215 RepID=UPI0030EE029B|tara:strand:+ start:253 stop:1371 length:1119 start_codon:yes stop_codon:yes gene_type:complete